jgi:protein-disulfide isomerase-like protein with CxxC motif
LNLDDVSQVNIYKQYLGSKGTILSAELLAQANLGKEIADYNIYENWAVQRAVYGANANRSFFQLRLNRALLNSNPSLVQVIAAGQASQADQPILFADIWRQSYKLTSPNILPVTTELPTDIGLPTAGYVNLEDADITVFDITDIASLAENIDQIQAGSTVWVAKTNQYDWDVFRAESVPGTIQHVCDNLDGTSLVLFSQQHGTTDYQTI